MIIAKKDSSDVCKTLDKYIFKNQVLTSHNKIICPKNRLALSLSPCQKLELML